MANLTSTTITGTLNSTSTITGPGSGISAINASNVSSGTLSADRLPTVPTTKGGTGLTSIGSADQVLKVNSGGTALEFGDAGGGVTDVNMVVVTSTSTYTPTSGTKFFKVYCVGAGGGGGGSVALDGDSSSGGGGGGAGGMAIRIYDATEMGATAAITIGSGGSGVNGEGTIKANDGGNTTFNPAGTGTTLTGNGGIGGYSDKNAGFNVGGPGGDGGGSSGGQTNARGSGGINGKPNRNGNNSLQSAGGAGGSSLFGESGLNPHRTTAGNTNGNSGSNGSGGSGSTSFNSSGSGTGGTGGAGIVVIEEYA